MTSGYTILLLFQVQIHSTVVYCIASQSVMLKLIVVAVTTTTNQSISTYLVPRLHKSGPTRHYKCHHSTRIVKTSAVIKAHIKKMSLDFPFESSSAVG